MILILLGAPGTGKGTQAKLLSQRNGWLHLSTGDMLRENVSAGTSLGRAAKSYIDEGALVPDDLVIKMLLERISQPDAQNGFLLEGFPRTLAQAQALDDALGKAGTEIDLAIHITAPDEEIIRRLASRWMCRQCGAIYNDSTGGSLQGKKCERCGGELYQRDDDKPETVKARLEAQKPPPEMLDHYRVNGKLREVDGTRPVEQVTDSLLNAIESEAA